MKILLRNIMIVLLCLSFCIPVTALSIEDFDSLSIGTHTIINTRHYSSRSYSGVRALANAEADTYYDNLDEFAASLRSSMVNREKTVTIGFATDGQLDNSFFDDIYDRLFIETGNPVEGDYLFYHFASYEVTSSGYAKDGVYYYTFIYSISYYSTLAEEAEVTAEVNKIASDIMADNSTEYDIIKAIYDYICANVSYDYEHLANPLYTQQFSAYGALIRHTSVCQGYASLFYRLAKECGIDARIVSGESNGEHHAWNIVKINDLYYNIDVTWDSISAQMNQGYKYFLKCDKDFTSHVRDIQFQEKSFTDAYPMSAENYSDKAGLNHRYDENSWFIDEYATADHSGTKSHHCLVCGTKLDVTDIPFVDSSAIYTNYTEKSWSKDGIDFVSSNGFMGSTGNGSFSQTGTMTRSMFVTVLWRIAGKPAPKGENIFTDLDPSQTWYHDAVIWAYENGIVTGTGGTSFSPNGNVTREQIATFMYRYVVKYVHEDVKGDINVITSFPDYSDVADYAKEALAWANSEGLIKGQAGNGGKVFLAPRNSATREEVAVVISRFCTAH